MEERSMRRAALCSVLTATFCTVPGLAMAGPYEEGLAAYEGKDYTIALKLLRPLAESGLAQAQEILGEMYAGGQGVLVLFDLREAIKWYHLAADHGSTKAQYNLAGMYDLGLASPRSSRSPEMVSQGSG
jgi:TPR repeat protein